MARFVLKRATSSGTCAACGGGYMIGDMICMANGCYHRKCMSLGELKQATHYKPRLKRRRKKKPTLTLPKPKQKTRTIGTGKLMPCDRKTDREERIEYGRKWSREW